MEEPEGSGGGFAAEEAENIIECRYYFGLPGSFRTKMSGASWSGASPEPRALTEGTGYPNEESIPNSPKPKNSASILLVEAFRAGVQSEGAAPYCERGM